MISPDVTSKKMALPINWISALFLRFQAIYGHKFTSTIQGIEDIATTEWANGMAGITGEQIKCGLEKCAQKKLQSGEQDWPPTLAEFRALCLPERVPAAHRDYIQLPRPKHAPEKMDEITPQLRAAVGHNGKRNSVMLPGEGYADYRRAYEQSGMTREQFDAQRLNLPVETDQEAEAERAAIMAEAEK